MTVNADVEDVMKQVRKKTILHVMVKGDAENAAKVLEEHDVVESVDLRDGVIYITLTKDVDDYSALATALIESGHQLRLFREEEVNLESAFMALTKGMGAKI